jgi:phage terminase large subunit GpA-like protein
MARVAPTLRSIHAHRRKVFLVSTPTIRGLSRIEREFEATDQRRFFEPCPHCGHAQWLKFDRLRWQKGRPETAEYHCVGCERRQCPGWWCRRPRAEPPA